MRTAKSLWRGEDRTQHGRQRLTPFIPLPTDPFIATIVFAVNVVLRLHHLLYRYQPGAGGRWKGTDNQIVERDADGTVVRVRFTPTPAVATPQAMADLVAHYQTAVEEPLASPLVVLPLAVLDFLCIHPFTDGNGRVGRLLSLLLLYHFDYTVGRYVSLERILERGRGRAIEPGRPNRSGTRTAVPHRR